MKYQFQNILAEESHNPLIMSTSGGCTSAVRIFCSHGPDQACMLTDRHAYFRTSS